MLAIASFRVKGIWNGLGVDSLMHNALSFIDNNVGEEGVVAVVTGADVLREYISALSSVLSGGRSEDVR